MEIEETQEHKTRGRKPAEVKKGFELPDLSGFDYKNLNGQSLVEYQKIAASLPLDQEFTFEQYSAFGEFRFRLNEITGEKEEYVYGIKLRNSDPINITKIPAGYARDLNAQLMAKHPITNSRYYLLKK